MALIPTKVIITNKDFLNLLNFIKFVNFPKKFTPKLVKFPFIIFL